MITKTCSKCKESKPITDFYKDIKYPDGYFCWCKSCKHEYYKAYYEKNKPTFQARNKNWYKEHK